MQLIVLRIRKLLSVFGIVREVSVVMEETDELRHDLDERLDKIDVVVNNLNTKKGQTLVD